MNQLLDELTPLSIPFFKAGSKVDSLFIDLLEDMNAYNPIINVLEKLEDGSHILHVDLPGVCKQDVNMDIDEGSIVIEAKRKGFRATSFQKRYKLPSGTDLDNIKAKYENGVLVITLPHAFAKSKKYSVDID